MFPLRQLIFSQTRGFRSSIARWTEKSLESKVQKLEQLKSGPLEDHGKFPGMPLHKPSKWDRIFLVWSGHYKTVGDVPNRLEHATVHKARNWARIRINIYMVGVGVGVCLFMVYLGKSDANKGITLEGQNLEWHRKINEQYRKEQEAKTGIPYSGEDSGQIIMRTPK